jgi:glycosyltransferase involved in cell wall biosynthesis
MTPGVLFVSNFLSSASLNRGYSEELADRMEARAWRITRTSSRPGKVARLADMLQTAWRRRHDYGVAHVDVFSGAAFVWAEAVTAELRGMGKPFALTLRGGNLPDFARRWPRRTRRLLGSAQLVTVPSPYLGEQMSPYRRDLVVVRNAIEANAYTFRPRSPSRPRLAWVRAFHEIYNPVLAVEVLARVQRFHPGATLMMLGPDKDGTRADVERRAEELGVREAVTLAGQVAKADIPRYLDDADVFINTTNIDNTPISVLEAMAAGLCVVSTSVGGIPYLLTHERDALLVPPRDADAMAAAVERIVADRALANTLSHAAHTHARACDWDAVLAHWETTLESLGAHG